MKGASPCRVASLFGLAVACAAPVAWGQVPDAQPQPPGQGAGVAVGAGIPAAAPAAPAPAWPPPAWPPPAWPPPTTAPAPAYGSTPAPGRPLAPPPAPRAPEAPPLELAGRIGFGIGAWAAPLALLESRSSQLTGLSGLGQLGYGGQLGLRLWVSEKVVLTPSLHLSLEHSWVPESAISGSTALEGESVTSGSVAPGLMFGYAAYRGKATRIIVSSGLYFAYSAGQRFSMKWNSGTSEDELNASEFKSLALAVPVGIALEQLFTPGISIVLGMEAPLLSYRSSEVEGQPAIATVGADFRSTQLSASIFFYTD
ncbi:hypothetical protein WMF37_25550 [Sorangium sp. So ce291]|uniref:hypothetical protein n=1 Tax=Sorangium sp. So ce291 TaxID=3133294 RepID=UPI003F5E02C3